jgi:hypothetical protein
VRQVDPAIGQATESWVMRDHQNRVTLIVQFAQKLDHRFLIGFI